jgi:hypothetical protein
VIVTGSDEECREQPSPEQSSTIANRLEMVEPKYAVDRLGMAAALVNDARESNRFASRQEHITGPTPSLSKTKVPLGTACGNRAKCAHAVRCNHPLIFEKPD